MKFMKPVSLYLSHGKLLYLAMASVLLINSCVLAPVNSHYESASTIEKNHLEASANLERYDAVVNGDAEKSNYNFGAILGYGFGERFDIKARYTFLNQFDDETVDNFTPTRYNYFGLSPKYQIVDKILAVKIPVGLYLYLPSNGESEAVYTVSPAVIGTLPLNQQADITLISQYQFSSEYSDFLGFSLGFGFSKDLSKWAVRPELGYQFETEDFDGSGFLNFGVGFVYSFNVNK